MKYIYIAIATIMFLSCYKSIDKPKDLIDEDTFVDMLTDLYMYKQNTPVAGQTIDYEEINGFIAQKYKVSPLRFKNSYEYYFLDNDKMLDIYEEVKENLQDKMKDIKTE